MENKENYGIRGLTTAGVIIILVILGGLIVAGITAQKRAKAPEEEPILAPLEEEVEEGIVEGTPGVEMVCCKTWPIIPEPIYSYDLRPIDECSPPLDEFGVPAVGVGYEVVSDSYCEESDVEDEKQQQVSCLPSDPPSITITNPTVGASYAVGQSVTIQWTSCNVQDIWLNLARGGKDFGLITYPNPVPASQGSYSWTVTNPAQQFTGLGTNDYQIGALQAEAPNVTVKSGTFSVHP